jgi:hypothetical protein
VTGKERVCHLVDDIINRRDWNRLGALCTADLEPKLRRAFSEFHAAFPDWHQEILHSSKKGRSWLPASAASELNTANGRASHPAAVPGASTRSTSFRITDNRISGLWGLEDTWTRMRQLAGADAGLGELGSLS